MKYLPYWRTRLWQALLAIKWGVVVGQERSEALTSINTLNQRALIGGLFSAMAVGLIIIYLARTITRPLVSLSEVAEQMGQGNLQVALPSTGSDEIGRLTYSIQRMATQLQELIESLEERIARRTRGLELVTLISEQLTLILQVDILLTEVVNQIREKFDYYHVHIYLVDEALKKLVVAEGTGEAGLTMKRAGHSINLGATTSLVARAARSAQVVRIDNVREAEDWLPNPLLPDTASEIAVPVVLEGQVVGVLDVQSDEIGHFRDSDERVLRSLANQIAVAIRNARYFAQVQTALAEAHAAQERYLTEGWAKVKTQTKGGYRHLYVPDDATLSAAQEQNLKTVRRQALGHDGPTLVSLDREKGEKKSLVAPIRLSNQTLGALQLQARAGEQWTHENLALIQAVLDQFAQTAENLRLFDETKQKAGQEQLVREVTERLRAAPNLEKLLEVAAHELSQHFSAAHAVVNLGIEPTEIGERDEPGNGHIVDR